MAESFSIFAKLHRQTAKLLLLVMIMPILAPIASASVASPEGNHCKRVPLVQAPVEAAVPTHDSAMHCHHPAALSPASTQSSTSGTVPTASLGSADCCNQGCDCCRNSKISTWARLALNHLDVVSFVAESTSPAADSSRSLTSFSAPGSPRAPPRS